MARSVAGKEDNAGATSLNLRIAKLVARERLCPGSIHLLAIPRFMDAKVSAKDGFVICARYVPMRLAELASLAGPLVERPFLQSAGH